MNLANYCSCCGSGIEAHVKKELKESGQWDSEGNLCGSCIDEQYISHQLQILDVLEDIYAAIKSPIKRFNLRHTSYEYREKVVLNLINKGYISFKIGGHG